MANEDTPDDISTRKIRVVAGRLPGKVGEYVVAEGATVASVAVLIDPKLPGAIAEGHLCVRVNTEDGTLETPLQDGDYVLFMMSIRGEANPVNLAVGLMVTHFGFQIEEQGRGDHPRKLIKEGHRPVPIPNPHKGETGPGLIRKMVRQAGIPYREWLRVWRGGR